MKLIANDLHQRWQTMVRRLKAEPGVTVTVAEKSLGSNEGYVKEKAKKLGIPPHSDLVTFVSWAGGVRLQWTIEGTAAFGGSIEIPNLAQLVKSPMWQGPMDALEELVVEAYGVSFDPAEGHVVPFDFFQHDPENIEIAAFLPRGDELDVIVSEDHIACIDSTALLSFAEYIDLVFRTYGSPLVRDALQMGCNEDSVRARDAFEGILTKEIPLSELVEFTRSEPGTVQTQEFFR